MKLGLLTDIHEHVEHLQTALATFRDQQVDQVVLVGDVVSLSDRLPETCRLLAAAKAIGVWGNHDYGLCVEPDEKLRLRHGDDVIQFMTSLRPRLHLEQCAFAHVEPWLNPEDLADLWFFEGMPESQDRLDRIFHSTPHRLIFAGHYHRWLLASPTRIETWAGSSPVDLSNGRYFVVLGALCEGHFAVFETDTSILQPFSLPAGAI